MNPSILAALLGVFTVELSAQTTAFTCQGRLENSGSPANGIYRKERPLEAGKMPALHFGSAFFRNQFVSIREIRVSQSVCIRVHPWLNKNKMETKLRRFPALNLAAAAMLVTLNAPLSTLNVLRPGQPYTARPGHEQLHVAAEQQSGQLGRLVAQQQLDNLQWHKLSERHPASGELVFPAQEPMNIGSTGVRKAS